MPLLIENPEAARFRAQSKELWRQSETGGGEVYGDAPNYNCGQLPCMMKEGSYKGSAGILKSGKPLFYARFPGSHLFQEGSGASESPVNLSLLDTIAVERDWAVKEQEDVRKWTWNKRYGVRHQKFDRGDLRPSVVKDGVSLVDTACDRHTEQFRFPVSMSNAQRREAQRCEDLDFEVGKIMDSTSRKIGDVRSERVAMSLSPSSSLQKSLGRSRSTQSSCRYFQTPGLLDRSASQTGFASISTGMPCINFGQDKFLKPKHRRPLPEVGFNKFGPVGRAE